MVVKQLALQGSSFRGHDESDDSLNPGKVLAWIGFAAKLNDQINCVVLRNAPGNAKYTSPSIQKEILGIIANRVRCKIREEIGDSCFSILVDEAVDEAGREQMSIILRLQLALVTSAKLFEEEITRRDLSNLAEDLSQSHFYVNPLGNCFIDVSAGDGEFVDPAFGVQFLRLNDTFNWSQYGAVNPPPPSTVDNLWDTRHGFPHRSGEKSKAIVDYKKQLNEKDEKLGKLKTQLRLNTLDLESAKRDMEKYSKWCYDFTYRYRDTISASEAAAKIRQRRVKVARSTFMALSPPAVPISP
ncbi:unnamed protein product, partial [Linum tenue]